jgi:peptidyl-prolyl cis-trans isomerase C
VSSGLTRIFKEPLIQFLLIGAGIYGAYGLFGTPAELNSETEIVVSADRINGFVAQWKSRWNRPPSRAELDGLINQYVREEILYRQAEFMGLAEDDPVTRRRMAQKLEFMTSDLARVIEPAEGELEAYLQANLEQFRGADQVTFLQVFFDPDKRGEATFEDANKALLNLQPAGVPDPELEAGDSAMLRSYYQAVSPLEISKQLGQGFTASLMELAAGNWHGPILSGYGVHLVYIYEQKHAPVPMLSDVETKVFEAWQAEKLEEFNKLFYEGLKERHQIIIEDGQLAPGDILPAKPDAATQS